MSLSVSASTAVLSTPDPVRAALEMRARGHQREALDLLSSAGEFSPDLYILRGDLQMELGLFKEAAGSYFTVTTSDPDNVYAQCNLGLSLYRLERWEPAAEAFQAVLKFDPHRDEVRLDLGDCLLQLRRFEEALSCFDQCWSDAARKRALFGRAVSLQQLRRLDEAEANYERLLTLDPQAGEALANLIAISLDVFDLGRVRKYAQRLLALDLRSSAALKGLALTALEEFDYGRAATYFFSAAELEPELLQPPPAGRGKGQRAVEYRISRADFERLSEAGRRLPGVARAAGAR
jgi:tetratricopeptide (TPR) repeat protein